eukprot:Seg1502.1 transcript_id=Seg1502.1/GoldUCD/mRNA.D3Y31 product=Syntaxin-7 protein_id=Seg1502.1/GoldUCD/D3Y31
MSKGDFGYGATVSASYQRAGGIDEFQSIFNDTSNKIFRINKNVSSLETVSKTFDSRRSSKDVENSIHSTCQETNRLAKANKNNFKKMAEYTNSPTNYRYDPQGNRQMQHRLQQSKLKQEFENSLSRYQAIQNVLSVKLKSHIEEELHLSPSKHDSSVQSMNDSDRETLVNFEEQQAQIQEEQQDLEALKEREVRIRQIETDILDVNEIFRDMAVLIHEQGDAVDSIEGNVEQAVVHVKEANVQLQRAKDYQKSARKRLCIIFVVVFVTAIIIGLIIYFSQSSGK